MTEPSDILITIPDDDLPKLSEIYKVVANWCPYAYSFIKTSIKWKEKGDKNLTTFMSPNNSWSKDGTFIALMQFGNYDLFVFTLDETCTNLYNGLKNTRRINWKQPTVFFNVHSLHYSTVCKICNELQLNIKFSLPYDVFTINKNLAVNFDISCTPDVYVQKLQVSCAPVIDSLYKAHRHRYEDGDKFIFTLLKMNEGFGLFSTETNDLLAWVMKTCLGQIGFLQTMDEHRKKGYGSLLTKIISKEIAEDDIHPMGSVAENNISSQVLFKNLGFQKTGQCYFLEVVKQ